MEARNEKKMNRENNIINNDNKSDQSKCVLKNTEIVPMLIGDILSIIIQRRGERSVDVDGVPADVGVMLLRTCRRARPPSTSSDDCVAVVVANRRSLQMVLVQKSMRQRRAAPSSWRAARHHHRFAWSTMVALAAGI